MKKLISCMCLITLLFSFSCSNETQKSSEVDEEVTIYIGSNINSASMPNWPNDFAKQMMEDLGFKIELRKVTPEQTDLYLSSGAAPVDILLCRDSKESQFVKADFVTLMDPYLDEYGQNILIHKDRNNLAREFLSNGTGNLYFKRVQTGPENPEGPGQIWNGYVMRWDLYKELGLPEVNNTDDFIDVIEEMVKLYPENEEGEKVYGMGIGSEVTSLWAWTITAEANNALCGVCYGAYVDLETWEVRNKYLDDDVPYWLSIDFYNELYNRGLLDPESFIMTDQSCKERMARGIYVAAPQIWAAGSYYSYNRKQDPNTLKGMISILPANGGVSAWYGASPVGGWEGTSYCIPKSSAYPEQAMQVLDYLDDPDNLRRLYSGVEGVHWEYDENGKPQVTDFALKLKAAGGDPWKQSGIGNSQLANLAGLSKWNTYKDGSLLGLFEDKDLKSKALNPLSIDYCKTYNVDYPGQLHVKQVEKGIAIDRRREPKDLSLVIDEAPSDLKRINSKLDSILESSLPNLVMAPREELAAEKAKVLEKLKRAGAEELYEWSVDTFSRADEKLMKAKAKYNIQ